MKLTLPRTNDVWKFKSPYAHWFNKIKYINYFDQKCTMVKETGDEQRSFGFRWFYPFINEIGFKKS